MMDENGGYILWVRRGLGEFAGWINAFNAIASNICDLPTYPVLFASYVSAYFTSIGSPLDEYEMWLLKIGALTFVFVSNVAGIRAVAMSSTMMALFVLLPFFLEPVALEKMNFNAWSITADPMNWSLFSSTLIWNYQGWDSLGCIAGEVKDGSKAYPKAILIALILM